MQEDDRKPTDAKGWNLTALKRKLDLKRRVLSQETEQYTLNQYTNKLVCSLKHSTGYRTLMSS